MSSTDPVATRKLVTFQYSLSNGDGVVLHAADDRPVQYVHGVGQLFPKLELALEGHRAGDLMRVKLFPEDVFGARDLDLVIEVPREELPPGERIEQGQPIVGTGPDGEQVRFTITEVTDDTVHMDANHPLAGQTLVFEVEIRDVRDATPEEIRQARTGL